MMTLLNFPKKSLLLGLAVGVMTAFGAPLACPTVTTMATYDAAGFQCTIGNILFTFDGPSYNYTPGMDENNNPTGVNVPDSDVSVTTYGTGLAGVATGFTFSASNWSTTQSGSDPTGTSNADINISFEACFIWMSNCTSSSVNNTPARFVNTTLKVNTNISETGGLDGNVGILAGENVADLSGNALGSGTINLTILDNTDSASESLGGTALSGGVNFMASGVGIDKDLNMATLAPGTSQVTSIQEDFTYIATPEPVGFVLTGIGMLLVFLLGKKNNILGLTALLLPLVIASSGSANATPLCTNGNLGTSGTGAYLAPGFSCTIGDVLFSNFSYTASGTGTASAGGSVAVTVVNSGGDLGLSFTPVWQVAGNQSENIVLSFNVQTSSRNSVSQFAASDTPTAAGAGQLLSTSGATIKTVSPNSTLGSLPFGYKLPCSTPGNCNTAGTTGLSANPGTLLLITDTFNLSSSGSGLGNSAHVSFVKDTIEETSVAPEPAMFVLIGSGLLATSLFARRRKSHTA